MLYIKLKQSHLKFVAGANEIRTDFPASVCTLWRHSREDLSLRQLRQDDIWWVLPHPADLHLCKPSAVEQVLDEAVYMYTYAQAIFLLNFKNTTLIVYH